VSFTDILIIFGIVIVSIVGVLAALALAAWIMWKRATREERTLIKRFNGLEIGSKLNLAGRLVRDGRIPLLARVALPVLVLYLALPIDIIPDFIPVIGWLDDVFLLVIGLNIVLRVTPRYVLDEQIETVERLELDRKAIEAERRGPSPDQRLLK
jgi:uncharacterized membrane protein YkvA (DUF1232 family)